MGAAAKSWCTKCLVQHRAPDGRHDTTPKCHRSFYGMLDSVDEIWDYSLFNLHTCLGGRPERIEPLQPHGRVALPSSWRNGAQHDPEGGFQARPTGGLPRANTGEQECREQLKPGFLHRAACFAQLKADVGSSRLSLASEIWSTAALTNLLATHGTFINIHKCCGQQVASPVEALRLAPLLSSGARVVSEHAYEPDERQYRGLVDFIPCVPAHRRRTCRSHRARVCSAPMLSSIYALTYIYALTDASLADPPLSVRPYLLSAPPEDARHPLAGRASPTPSAERRRRRRVLRLIAPQAVRERTGGVAVSHAEGVSGMVARTLSAQSARALGQSCNREVLGLPTSDAYLLRSRSVAWLAYFRRPTLMPTRPH